MGQATIETTTLYDTSSVDLQIHSTVLGQSITVGIVATSASTARDDDPRDWLDQRQFHQEMSMRNGRDAATLPKSVEKGDGDDQTQYTGKGK